MSIEDYNNYLQLKRFVSENHIPFYTIWVNRFLHFCKIDFGQVGDEKLVEKFLVHIGKTHPQWQVDQSKPLPKSPHWNAQWVTAAQMMKKMLWLKQLSYRTEQSYMSWKLIS